MNSAAVTEISQTALDEIAAFEKFITEYFENTDNNNTIRKPSQQPISGPKQKVSASSILSEVLELSIWILTDTGVRATESANESAELVATDQS